MFFVEHSFIVAPKVPFSIRVHLAYLIVKESSKAVNQYPIDYSCFYARLEFLSQSKL